MEQRYIVGREVTPQHLACILGACSAIYEARQDVGVAQDCLVGACPKIIDPRREQCLIGGCPNVTNYKDGYLVIGTQVKPVDVGLEKKVAPHEALVFVPRELIDRMHK